MATFSRKGRRIGVRGALFPSDQCLEKAAANHLKFASFAKRLGKHVVRGAPWWKDARKIEKGARP
jgi:hypothetical protein